MKRDQTTGHLASLFTIIIWGTAFISTKILLVDFRPVEILFFRFVMGLIPLLLVYPLLRLGRIGSALSPGILRSKCWARSRQAFISIWSP